MNPNYPASYLLTVVLLLTSLVSSLGAYRENPIARIVYQSRGYDSRAHHSDSSTRNYRSLIKPRLPSFLHYESKVVVRRSKAISAPESSTKVVNVDDFGAKADGTDDSEAFQKAWNRACSSKESAVIVVPKNKSYRLKPVTFSGPCKSNLQFFIYGTIKASTKINDYKKDRRHWLVFQNLRNFVVRGGGTINGNGRTWWVKSCKINKTLPCKHAPTAVTFVDCKNLVVASLRFLNAQQMHLTFQQCMNVRALKLAVLAPGNSPNTDGIHVTSSQNVLISKSLIRTGDDCISIVSGSKNVQATGIVCGPGHGISIGSLGGNEMEAQVSNVVINRATLTETTNGVRIKTWQGGSGYAKNITFQNVVMHKVSNPIIIDQNYCDKDGSSCPKQASAVKISNVIYRNIKGTSKSEVAVKFDCSESNPCQSISLQDIRLTRGEDHGSAKASCVNVELAKRGKVSPVCS